MFERAKSDERQLANDGRGIGRRDYLRMGAAVGAGTIASTIGVGSAAAGGDPTTLEDPAPADRTVGGGDSYEATVSKSDATYVVDTHDELLTALDDARSGDVVYVEDDAAIDLTGDSSIGMADGVTLASGRGTDGSDGGLLYTDDYPDPLFKVYGDGVRFTGLRLRGPRWEYFDPSDISPYIAEGIWLLGDDGEVDNCQLYGWPHAAVSVGSSGRVVSAHVHHCSVHDNPMEALGYGVNLYNGHSLIEHNYFDGNRHSVTAFGHDTNGYEARYNLVGSAPISHAFDVHALSENTDGGNVAGGTISVHHNSFRFTHDTLDRAQEAVAVRGVPDDWADVERNWFYHPECPDEEDVEENGQAYRQDNLDEDEWTHFSAAGNHYGSHDPCSDIGCPRPRRTLAGTAVDPTDGGTAMRSGVGFEYVNGFDQQLTFTDISLAPRSDDVAALNDPSYDVGEWASEVHVSADVQEGTTDVGGGVSLPATIDLDSDGHSGSPDTEPIFSAGSTAQVALYEFRDADGNAIDMDDEVIDVEVTYRLEDGTTGSDSFVVAVPDSGELYYAGDAVAVDPANTGERSGVAVDLTNRFDQELVVTDVGLTPSSGKVAELSDPSYGSGQWESEVHVAADTTDGVCDVGGGTSLPATIGLDADGFDSSVSVEPVFSADSSATVSLYQFRGKNGKPLDMVGRDFALEVSFVLADGTSATTTFGVTPTSG